MATDLYEHHDYLGLDDMLTEEHKLVRDAVRNWVKKSVTPIVNEYAQKSSFPSHLVKELGAIGAFGPHLPVEYGGGGLDHIAYGLIMQEIERADSGIRSTASVQGSLVMYPIYKFGSEAQKRKFLPKLGSGEYLGCFGLTEPNHGSDPGSMQTYFTDEGDHVRLNGAKMWISNSPLSDVAVVWAKDPEGIVREVIESAKNLCSEHGAKLVVLAEPFPHEPAMTQSDQAWFTGYQVVPDRDGEAIAVRIDSTAVKMRFEKFLSELSKTCGELSVPLVSAQDDTSSARSLFIGDKFLNDEGHQYLAEKVAPIVEELR